ncbi:Zonadhesin [Madurella mycetomatis]|uniref:Zonadhesin n=1 Tax=Madurella mycetomatis TaxID=100816 RepID=A0A175W742_9PEZI|nr:Zonadhesin [Madurella mycetomatis]
MQQSFVHPRDDRAAYEYSVQATEDRHEASRGDPTAGHVATVWRSKDSPNYKPKPLRWPFITLVIVLLLVAIALVVYAEKQMPDSDSSARILGIHPNASQPLRFARDVFANLSSSTVADTTTAGVTVLSTTYAITTTARLPESSFSSGGEAAVLVQTLSETAPLSQTTLPVAASVTTHPPASTMTPVLTSIPVSTTALPSTTRLASASSMVSLPSGAKVIPISVSVSTFTTNITVPISTVTYSSEFTTTRISSFTTVSTYSTTVVSTITKQVPTTVPESYWSSDGSQGTIPASTRTGPELDYTTFFPGTPTTVTGAVTVTATETVKATSTITGVVIPSVGSVTITYYTTIFPPTVRPPVTKPATLVKVTGVDVIDPATVAVVHSATPVVVVVPSQNVQTLVIDQRIATGVTQVGGSLVTDIVVITPSPVSSQVVTDIGGKPVTVINTPPPATVVTMVDGAQRTIIEPPPVQTVITMEGGVLTTVAGVVDGAQAAQPVTYTVVNNVGGTPVSQIVVTTPTGPPYQPISYTVVQDVGGTLVAQVVVTTPTGPPGQPITYTAVDIVGGTAVTQVVVTTPASGPFQPVSFTITTNVGGTPTVVTLTPPPTTIVETINGTPVTRVSTPPATSFTTTIGGKLTTQTLVTTPTGTKLITLTFVSTSGGKLSTFTSTISPTTFTTTLSESLRTITSTPVPSTTFSTRPGTTRTYTSTSTPTASGTAGNPPLPSVTGTTRVFSWTEADIFLGTFLPPLLGVGLIIPLRIIDLNAKLYQPFQTLARAGGGSGRETLLMQYSGLMAFVTPVMTMLQGHPIPFLTTLMVGCASFIVPLATEAIGLKLHGECYLNTASSSCGPSLGISPAPAYALIGLMAAVVIMLLLVLILASRWVTGLYANPWNLAGIASLAGNPHIRIQQTSESAVRRAVSAKQYGLGYFQSAAGREEYGIVLTDEAGRGLQDQDRPREGDSESELFEANAAVAKGGTLSQPLPFMTLRLPWRIAFVVFQFAVLVFVIVYHTYYRGGIRDDGRLWLFMNSNTFGVRFVAAIVGVIIAFCWQSFFVSVSTMIPFTLMAQRTQPASRSILFSPSTNPFSGVYSSIKHRHAFLLAVSIAAILSEFLPVILSNVPFNLAQTGTAATVCAVLSAIFLCVMLAVLAWSFFVRYPPMPVDPRCIAGVMYYVSQSQTMLEDMEGVSVLDGKERERRVMEAGRRYFYGVLAGGSWRRMGVDCDAGPEGEVMTAYQGAQGEVWGDPSAQARLPRIDE